VTDEPFVHPYLSFVQSVERVCHGVETEGVPCFRVDGSTTVPPACKLSGRNAKAPNKAWIWEKQTHANRKGQVLGAVKHGYFDAPEVSIKLPSSFFLGAETSLTRILPSDWTNKEVTAPGKRPWSVQELTDITDLKGWISDWPGIDATVPPCAQTHGASGRDRWVRFLEGALKGYARSRNNIRKPHDVSRMSCYLNYGTVSIFAVINDVWQTKGGGKGKFLDEVIKWREIGYAHAFVNGASYNQEAAVPAWSRQYLDGCRNNNVASNSRMMSYQLDALAEGRTESDTWNAMQRYLVETGELHNNARMTWGKSVVHWQKHGFDVPTLLQQLCYLNDRFALDGLSPPSYAGLLWCLGWCDKPQGGGRLSEKPASRYRVGPDGFQEAQRLLLASSSSSAGTGNPSVSSFFAPAATGSKKRAKTSESPHRGFGKSEKEESEASLTPLGTKSMKSYFAPAKPQQTIG